MGTKTSTQIMLTVLHILSWIIFVGLSIDACGVAVNTILSIAKPEIRPYLWNEINLDNVYNVDRGFFIIQSSFIVVAAMLKATLFYAIIRVLLWKKFDLSRPFSNEMGQFIKRLAYFAIAIGMISWAGSDYAAWLSTQNIIMPTIENLHLSGADVWLFMGIVLLVIAHIFKRGIELQSENELTI